MEHDPLGDSNDALLRLIEGGELCLDGVVGVCHNDDPGTSLAAWARDGGAQVHSNILQLEQSRRRGCRDVVGGQVCAVSWSAAGEALPAPEPAGGASSGHVVPRRGAPSLRVTANVASALSCAAGQLGAPLNLQPDVLHTTAIAQSAHHPPSPQLASAPTLRPFILRLRHGRQVSVAG